MEGLALASWATIGFDIGHRSIVRAFDESRKTFEREAASITLEMEAHLARATDGAQDEDEDRAYEEHIAENAWEAEQSLKVIREAFVVAIYHFWENQFRTWDDESSATKAIAT